MRTPLFIALEEQLETEKLADLTTQANKTGEYEVLYDAVASLKESKENEDDSSTDGEEPTPEGETLPEDDELSTGTEELRNVTFSLESFNEGPGSRNLIGVVTGTLTGALTAITILGLTYGPDIVKALYKGVIYVFGKLARLLYVGTKTLAKYIERRVNAFSSLKKSIESLEKSLEIVGKNGDLTGQQFTDKRVINSLKIGLNADFTANTKQLTTFLNGTILGIGRQVKNDIQAISYLIAASQSKLIKPPIDLFVVKPFLNGMKQDDLAGYENDELSTVGYKCLEALPSDVVLMAFLPRQDLDGIEQLVKAYNESKLFLGMDLQNFKSVSSVDYMTPEQLKLFLKELKNLCDACITHERFYTDIMVSKKQLKFGFKNYLTRLVGSDRKVTVKESLVEYVFLKAMFIDKVYLVGSMDVHDYCAKIINYGISFAEAHVKKLS
jgi:hypothetical protein